MHGKFSSFYYLIYILGDGGRLITNLPMWTNLVPVCISEILSRDEKGSDGKLSNLAPVSKHRARGVAHVNFWLPCCAGWQILGF